LTYFLHPWFDSHYDIFEDIVKRLRFELG